MSKFDFSHLFEYREVKQGDVLLAEPFLEDENFERSVVLICDESKEGYVGLIQNKQVPDVFIGDFVEELAGFEAEVFFGGPVDKHLLQYIHTLGDKIENSIKLTDELYWGGDFEQLKTLINCEMVQKDEIRFFLGYAGWEREQLGKELREHSWLLTTPKLKILKTTLENLWREILLEKGGAYQILANSPSDPRLN